MSCRQRVRVFVLRTANYDRCLKQSDRGRSLARARPSHPSIYAVGRRQSTRHWNGRRARRERKNWAFNDDNEILWIFIRLMTLYDVLNAVTGRQDRHSQTGTATELMKRIVAKSGLLSSLLHLRDIFNIIFVASSSNLHMRYDI